MCRRKYTVAPVKLKPPVENLKRQVRNITTGIGMRAIPSALTTIAAMRQFRVLDSVRSGYPLLRIQASLA
jgi:hypothetical protein